jgi:DNA repair exonuclease SbcCD nuclease subunit
LKVALITDQHFGARGDSVQCLDYYQNFYDNIFFPTLHERDISTILILGDTFDRRKYVNFNTLARSKQIFFDKAERANIKIVMIAGNHDTYFKNTNEINSPSLLLAEYTNIEIIDEPKTLDVNGYDVCFLPWICTDNYENSMKEIEDTKAKFCMGHLEISGFVMYRGAESHGGLSASIFDKFNKTFSGHYHHRSSQGSIHYLGNPYELTWQDYNDPRGFHIFDLFSEELEFIQNTYTMFVRQEYDDTLDLISDFSIFTDKYVKIIVVNKTNHYKFDQFVTSVYKSNPQDVKIIEDFSEFSEGQIDETINLEDTSSVLMNYIESLETEVDKDKIKSFMKTLYTEALNYESK